MRESGYIDRSMNIFSLVSLSISGIMKSSFIDKYIELPSDITTLKPIKTGRMSIFYTLSQDIF